MFKRWFILILLCPIFLAIMPQHHPTPAHAECENDYEGRRTRYKFDTTLLWSRRLLQVQQTVYYRNDHTTDLTELVFHSEPHRISQIQTLIFQNAFDTEGNIIEGVTIDKMRMAVPLTEAVAPGCDAVIRLQYDIKIYELANEENGGSNTLGWLAYTNRQINIAHWFPTIAPYGYMEADQWYTPQRHFIGEQHITELADFDMTIRLEGAPLDVVLVAPGLVTQPKGDVWQIVLKGGRELGLSFSTAYTKSEQLVDGVNVELYTFVTTNRGAVTQALNDAVQAVALFNEIYGQYPHERLVLVEGDFYDGMELSGMTFIGKDWFLGWNGDQVQYLTIITVHEIAHEWFYSQVMNDQGTYPYLDESLATYSELLYYQRYYPDRVEDWWQFRIRGYNLGDDPVDSPVYGYSNWRPYINTVYFRGVMMLDEIRAQIGDALFMEWLSEYYQANHEGIAKPADFWGAMSRFSYDSTQAIREKYLSNPNILE